ncbi:Ppx/GppA family phosphatase [Streptomyces sp. T21Q-yed]|uniref:Ppx/GppA phosphatase family protein n=1 Tax=Streptomyces sp. T21Q-yed TaxID=3018441 RepID=UPI0023DFC58B|nr:Ppx/GppA family phosphatase [Streptomyces sp. T21Q-yed]MDF3144653.1 Ppx/GppA family phosphatase [Streptomyces sp. T21Q-yed]
MRISVVDVGSNTVRLVVADAQGGVPLPVHTEKWRLRLSEQVRPGDSIPEEAVERLACAVSAAGRTATRWGATAPLAFATAVVRAAPNRQDVVRTVRARTGVSLCTLPGEVEAELTFLGARTAVVRAAPNRQDVVRTVRARTGVSLCTLPGEVEAELTFLGARRWMGWRSGPLALLDIGGGSLEVAFGRGRLPDFVASLPLGAARLTHEFLADEDPPAPRQVRALRRKVRHQLRDVAARIRWEGPHTAAATSRTFQQLGRLCGAAPGRHGPFMERQLARANLREAIGRLAALPAAERAALPGISAPRAGQSLAGAVVAHTAMKLTGLSTVTICPWAIREGIMLRHIEDGASWWAEITRLDDVAVSSEPVPLRIASAPATS